MTEDEKRLIIAKGISALFDVIDTIGFDEHKIDAYTGNTATTGEILALRRLLADRNDVFDYAYVFEIANIKSVVWS